ncbi:hypothetical protein [Rhizorhabdus sp.]|uniref:phage fiber-tail adaptor protein n=1 Tax=Rhizorhabdus sp. TaxID=1968843 RepID=UPI00198E5646|nr:hypothetical protein [Rhizorhabdus sp.]MBD3762448.1 hypothetical protein [Rhizorhabdus sp.]
MTSPTYTASPKDPADIEDYGLDCTAWLNPSETITAQTVTADGTDLTISGLTQVSGVVRWRASGGLLGKDHAVTVRVTSSAGRRAERTIIVPIREL